MKNKMLAILIGMATLLGSAMPIFAADNTAVKLTDFSYALRINKTQYVVPGSVTEITVPVYISFVSSDMSFYKYYSGYCIASTGKNFNNMFEINPTGLPVNVRYDYFEPASDTITFANRDYTNGIRLIMSNFYFDGGVYLIGYNHYSMDEQHTEFTLNFKNENYDVTPSTHNIFKTDFEYGFYNACKQAVNDALDANQSIYEIVHDLQDIYQEISQSNQSFLTYFQNANQTLDDVDRLLGLILTQNENINQTLRQFYDLYYGVVHASKDASDIQQDVDEKAQVSASLAAGMAMDRPELDAQDVNINEMIDQDVNTKFGIAVGSIFSNNFIVTMMMISVSAMIIGFVLYGKK